MYGFDAVLLAVYLRAYDSLDPDLAIHQSNMKTGVQGCIYIE